MASSSVIACPACHSQYTVPNDGKPYSCRCGSPLRPAAVQAAPRSAPPPPVALLDHPPPGPTYRCPFCGNTAPPRSSANLSAAGWVVFIVLICTIVGWVLFWLPWVCMREDKLSCSACGR